MKKLCITFIAMAIISIVLFSCKNKVQIDNEDISEGLLDSISLNLTQSSSDTLNPISQPASRGSQWKAWEKWFKECPENKTFKKNIIYLGPTSSKSPGYVLSKDLQNDQIDFFKIEHDEKQLKKFYEKGTPVKSCDFTKISGFSFDMVANQNVLAGTDAELAAIVATAKKITIKSGSFRIESFDLVPFENYINSSTSDEMKSYRDALRDKKNIFLTKVLKISGFSAEIETSDSIGVNLKAQLAKGLDVSVIAADSTKKAGFDLKFKSTSAKTVNVSSTGEISLFAQIAKGKKP